MRPVTQTLTGVTQGNCFQAAVASVLEVPMERVLPQPVDPDGGTRAGEAWSSYLDDLILGLTRYGVTLWPIELAKPLPLSTFGNAPVGLWIAGVKTPSEDVDHALVCRGQEVIHDPYPREWADRPDWLHDPEVRSVFILGADPAGALS